MTNPNDRPVYFCDRNAIKHAETRADLVSLWRLVGKQLKSGKLSPDQAVKLRGKLTDRARELGLPVKEGEK